MLTLVSSVLSTGLFSTTLVRHQRGAASWRRPPSYVGRIRVNEATSALEGAGSAQGQGPAPALPGPGPLSSLQNPVLLCLPRQGVVWHTLSSACELTRLTAVPCRICFRAGQPLRASCPVTPGGQGVLSSLLFLGGAVPGMGEHRPGREWDGLGLNHGCVSGRTAWRRDFLPGPESSGARGDCVHASSQWTYPRSAGHPARSSWCFPLSPGPRQGGGCPGRNVPCLLGDGSRWEGGNRAHPPPNGGDLWRQKSQFLPEGTQASPATPHQVLKRDRIPTTQGSPSGGVHVAMTTRHCLLPGRGSSGQGMRSPWTDQGCHVP